MDNVKRAAISPRQIVGSYPFIVGFNAAVRGEPFDPDAFAGDDYLTDAQDADGNPAARAVRSTTYRPRITRNAKRYDRKRNLRGTDR